MDGFIDHNLTCITGDEISTDNSEIINGNSEFSSLVNKTSGAPVSENIDIPRIFEFDVNFPPTSLKRHRHTKFGNHTYDPSAGEKKEFLSKLLMQLPKKPFDKPIVAELYFYEVRPKSHYRTGKYSNEMKANAPKHNVVKKDIDNFVKFVFDSLNKHLYVDDSQIFELKCGKYYSDREYSYICGKFAEITD